MKYIDLTHSFQRNMPIYPGDPAPELKQVAFFEKDGFNDHEIKTAMHVGTHMDGPLHMVENGRYLSEIEPEHFFGRGHLIDARGKELIDTDLLADRKINKGDIVLIWTDFSKQFGSPEYFETYPEVSLDFAKRLIESGVHAIGLDSPSPDRSPYTVHKTLLAHEILIIENLTNLEALANVKSFEVAALPIKFKTDGAPVRVIARAE